MQNTPGYSEELVALSGGLKYFAATAKQTNEMNKKVFGGLQWSLVPTAKSASPVHETLATQAYYLQENHGLLKQVVSNQQKQLRLQKLATQAIAEVKHQSSVSRIALQRFVTMGQNQQRQACPTGVPPAQVEFWGFVLLGTKGDGQPAFRKRRSLLAHDAFQVQVSSNHCATASIRMKSCQWDPSDYVLDDPAFELPAELRKPILGVLSN